MDAYDVVIVGAGPAGLSAALVLGRCGRRVLVCDSGTPRNARSRSLNGYLTRDGILPVDFLDLGWWPSFNLADVALSVGCGLLVLKSLRAERVQPA